MSPSWKRTVLVALAISLGLSLAVAVVIGVLAWYRSRPLPWNNEAIKATFDFINTENERNTTVFGYTLENKTRVDYRMQQRSDILIMSKLKRQKSLVSSDEDIKVDLPVFIPPGERLDFRIHLGLSYPHKPKAGQTFEEQREYQKRVGDFVNRELGNLDGFVIYDKVNRYQINFPKGW